MTSGRAVEGTTPTLTSGLPVPLDAPSVTVGNATRGRDGQCHLARTAGSDARQHDAQVVAILAEDPAPERPGRAVDRLQVGVADHVDGHSHDGDGPRDRDARRVEGEGREAGALCCAGVAAVAHGVGQVGWRARQ